MLPRRSATSFAAVLSIPVLVLFGIFAAPQKSEVMMALARSAQIMRMMTNAKRGAEMLGKIGGEPAAAEASAEALRPVPPPEAYRHAA